MATPTSELNVLIFSRTAGYRHDSIDAGVAVIRDQGERYGFGVTATDDPATFTAAGLAPYRVVMFLNTIGPVLDDDARVALEAHLRAGAGFVGVHCAAATEDDWPFYGDLLGARFAGHPDLQPAVVQRTDDRHPATAHLPDSWSCIDEWYNFQPDPRTVAHILLTVDESSYHGGEMGADHPMAWCHEFQGCRSFYTALGHTSQLYAEPWFQDHLLGGIRYAAAISPPG